MKAIAAGALVTAALAWPPSAVAKTERTAPRRTLVVSSYEYAFNAPDSIEAGPIAVSLVNHGRIGHQVVFVRLDDSSSLVRVMRSLIADTRMTSGVQWMGGVETALPGNSNETILILRPGRYVLVCEYEGNSGHAHVSMGMLHTLVVTDGPINSDTLLPSTSATIRLSDAHIGVSGSLHVGRQLVRVENVGARYHHLDILRITGKHTRADVDKWDGTTKPQPIEFIGGGAAALDPGIAIAIDLTLEPGRYLFASITSDEPGPRRHYSLELEREVVITESGSRE